jgi:hypothetical protein
MPPKDAQTHLVQEVMRCRVCSVATSPTRIVTPTTDPSCMCERLQCCAGTQHLPSHMFYGWSAHATTHSSALPSPLPPHPAATAQVPCIATRARMRHWSLPEKHVYCCSQPTVIQHAANGIHRYRNKELAPTRAPPPPPSVHSLASRSTQLCAKTLLCLLTA